MKVDFSIVAASLIILHTTQPNSTLDIHSIYKFITNTILKIKIGFLF